MAACSILRGIGCRAHCAGERICAAKLAVVMRVEVSVAIAATRNSSGRGASFCVRKRESGAIISVRFLMFWFIKFDIFIIIFILSIVAFVVTVLGPAGVSKSYAKRAAYEFRKWAAICV